MINKSGGSGSKPIRQLGTSPRGPRAGVPRALKATPQPPQPTLKPSNLQQLQQKKTEPERDNASVAPPGRSMSRESSVERVGAPRRAPAGPGVAPRTGPARSSFSASRGSRDMGGSRNASVGGGSGGGHTPKRTSSIGREPSIDSRQSSMMMTGDDFQMSADGDFRINSTISTDDFSFLFPNEPSCVHQLSRLGFAKPLASQAHFMAAFLSVLNNRSGKPYLSVQTSADAGKTVGLALSLLSTLDSSSSALQAIILSSAGKSDFPDAMSKFASVHSKTKKMFALHFFLSVPLNDV